MGVKVLIHLMIFPFGYLKEIWYNTWKQEIDKLMKELGTDNAIQIIGLLAIAKGKLEEIKERKLI